jgi:GMP synthase (glutamine-hydrolysing)
VNFGRGDTIRSGRVLVLQHARSEGLGTIEDALKFAGLEFEYVHTYQGQPIPENRGSNTGLVVMGGPMGVYETDRYPFLNGERKLIENFLEARLPILGVCLGSQLLAAALGAKVQKGARKEIGWRPVQLSHVSGQDRLWAGQPSRFVAYHWHGDVFDLPKDAVLLASSDLTPAQAFRYGERVYGFLFHMEVSRHQIHQMLSEFADEIQEENLSAAKILEESSSFLTPLQGIGATVFQRWAEMVG